MLPAVVQEVGPLFARSEVLGQEEGHVLYKQQWYGDGHHAAPLALSITRQNLRPNIATRQRLADVFAQRLGSLLSGFKDRGLSQREIVAELNAAGIPAAGGGNGTSPNSSGS